MTYVDKVTIGSPGGAKVVQQPVRLFSQTTLKLREGQTRFDEKLIARGLRPGTASWNIVMRQELARSRLREQYDLQQLSMAQQSGMDFRVLRGEDITGGRGMQEYLQAMGIRTSSPEFMKERLKTLALSDWFQKQFKKRYEAKVLLGLRSLSPARIFAPWGMAPLKPPKPLPQAGRVITHVETIPGKPGPMLQRAPETAKEWLLSFVNTLKVPKKTSIRADRKFWLSWMFSLADYILSELYRIHYLDPTGWYNIDTENANSLIRIKLGNYDSGDTPGTTVAGHNKHKIILVITPSGEAGAPGSPGENPERLRINTQRDLEGLDGSRNSAPERGQAGGSLRAVLTHHSLKHPAGSRYDSEVEKEDFETSKLLVLVGAGGPGGTGGTGQSLDVYEMKDKIPFTDVRAGRGGNGLDGGRAGNLNVTLGRGCELLAVVGPGGEGGQGGPSGELRTTRPGTSLGPGGGTETTGDGKSLLALPGGTGGNAGDEARVSVRAARGSFALVCRGFGGYGGNYAIPQAAGSIVYSRRSRAYQRQATRSMRNYMYYARKNEVHQESILREIVKRSIVADSAGDTAGFAFLDAALSMAVLTQRKIWNTYFPYGVDGPNGLPSALHRPVIEDGGGEVEIVETVSKLDDLWAGLSTKFVPQSWLGKLWTPGHVRSPRRQFPPSWSHGVPKEWKDDMRVFTADDIQWYYEHWLNEEERKQISEDRRVPRHLCMWRAFRRFTEVIRRYGSDPVVVGWDKPGQF